jgi:hypothetical protein
MAGIAVQQDLMSSVTSPDGREMRYFGIIGGTESGNVILRETNNHGHQFTLYQV